ncbi:MAG: indole-3-glycerol phosphate synthase TrpC [Zetaproteobacteria bacterium]|nr:MAG: indole-3-glycerol phosphate synthase TrpC [Zetaproteobacteria bacterium]
MSDSILQDIAAYKREWVKQRKSEISETALSERAKDYTPMDFAETLIKCIEHKTNTVIAEVKKASPSRGVIRQDFDPVAIAASYETGGATCLSVLTDAQYFQGSDAYLSNIRKAVSLPILRKDFMLDPYQVIEARAIGADAILIILNMVDDALAADLTAAAREQGLSILPEVHNRRELERALKLDTRLIGINNRNLHDFSTSLDTTIELLPAIPYGKTIITESGIHTSEDIRRMNEAGVHGFLIGESLMRKPDPGKALASLLAG